MGVTCAALMAGTCMGISVSSGYDRLRPLFCLGSVAPVAARRYDRHERFEVEIDNGLERLGGGAFAQALGQ